MGMEKDMLCRMKNLISVIFAFAIVLNTAVLVSFADAPEISAESAILVDIETGLVLYSKNEHERLYPASITKLMTTLLALEYANGDYSDEIYISETAVDLEPGASSIGMIPGETLTLEQALYAVLLPSANEVSNAVAEHIAGSIEAFAEMMTERAKELGCTDTNFKNPHGLHDEEHYTSAYDMYLIMKELLKHPDFIMFASTTHYEIPPTELQAEPRMFNNSNRLIRPATDYYNEDVVCGKTGYTDEARHTLVTLSRKDGAELICAVMKTPQFGIYTDTTALIEYGFSLYADTVIFDGASFSAKIPVIQSISDTENPLEIDVRATGDVLRYLPETFNVTLIEQRLVLPAQLYAPVSQGDRIGKLELLYNGEVFGEVDLRAGDSVALLPAVETSITETETNGAKDVEDEPAPESPLSVYAIIAIAAAGFILLMAAAAAIFTFVRAARRKKRARQQYLNLRSMKRELYNYHLRHKNQN